MHTKFSFRAITYNVRSIMDEAKLEHLLCNLDDFSWDLIMLTETWRPLKIENWTSLNKHSFLGAGGSKGSCGTGFILHSRWRYRAFHPVSNRVSALDLDLDGERYRFIVAYFPHSGKLDDQVQTVYDEIDTLVDIARANSWNVVIGGDANAEVGIQRAEDLYHVVGPFGVRPRNLRGEWLVQWASIRGFVITNTMFSGGANDLWTYSHGDTYFQLDYILVEQRFLFTRFTCSC